MCIYIYIQGGRGEGTEKVREREREREREKEKERQGAGTLGAKWSLNDVGSMLLESCKLDITNAYIAFTNTHTHTGQAPWGRSSR